MATTIVTKSGSGAPAASDLVAGELAVDLTNGRLYTEDSGGTVLELGLNPTTLAVDTDTLVVDATNNRVGIGTASPTGLLHLSSSAPAFYMTDTTNNTESVISMDNAGSLIFNADLNNEAGSSNVRFAVDGTERMRIDSSGLVSIKNVAAPTLRIENTDTSLTTNQTIGDIDFYQTDPSGTGVGVVSKIRSINSSSFQGEAGLAFHTGTTSSLTERMRIDVSGNLLVGKTAANTSVVGVEARGDGLLVATRASGQPLLLERRTDNGDLILLRKDAAAVGSIGVEGGDLTIGNGDAGIQFVNGTEHLRPHNMTTNTATTGLMSIGSAAYLFKDLYLAGGVYLGGTGAANKLDDYEEGTWTPTITNSTGAYNFQVGRYTKIGNLVYVTCNLKTPFTNTGTTGQDIGGLPFTSENVANLFSIGTIFPVSGFNQANSDLTAQISINSTGVALYTVAPATGINYTRVASNTFGTSVEFEFSACYRTAS